MAYNLFTQNVSHNIILKLDTPHVEHPIYIILPSRVYQVFA